MNRKILKRSKYANASAIESGRKKRGKGGKTNNAPESVLDTVWETCGNDFAAGGQHLFEQLVLGQGQVKSTQFFDEYYERKALFMPNTKPSANPFTMLLTSKELEEMLDSGKLCTQTCTVSKFTEEGGRVNKPYSTQTWNGLFNREKYSVRLTRPTQVSDTLFKLHSLLEAYFANVTCGMNVYWTPTDSQGFAPHYDDVDVYILQLEGTKLWTVYESDGSDLFPLLPTTSSLDFHPDELTKLPSTQYELKPGDVLYLPRGFIHQASAMENTKHSLHITISTSFMTKGQLLQRAVTKLVEQAQARSVDLRRTVPRRIVSEFGLQFMDEESLKPKREQFQLEMLQILKKTVSLAEVDLDSALDELMGEWLHGRQGPQLEEEDEDNQDSIQLKMDSELEIKVLGSARISVENGLAVLRHCMKNTRVFQEVDPRGLEFDLDDGPVLQAVLESQGPFEVKSLPSVLCQPGEQEEEFGGRVRVLQAMLSEGILRVVKL
ncbi:hypothetical protein BASA81_008531 [Batrachochytrium salamandrivorans]|nr:hypothetical protein BASA81_008531 [Batrachochytrium salamandrivorans]